MLRAGDRGRNWLAVLALAGVLSPAGPGLGAPRPTRTPAPAALSPPPAATAAPAPAPCAPVVAEIRRDAVHVAAAPACGLVPGTTLRSGDGTLLEVTDAGSTWARLIVREGPAPVAGQRLEVVSAPPPTPNPTMAAPRGATAGPGVVSRQAPPNLFVDAAQRRTPRPIGAGAAASGPRPAPGGLTVHGRLGAGVTGVVDLSDRAASWWRPFLQSTVDLERPGTVAWTYRHRLRGQWRFDGRSSSQPWDGDEPRLGLHELRAGAAFLERRLTIGLGRLAPDGVAGAATVDGALLEGRVGNGVHLGVFGGLLPHPTSLLPGLDGTGFGAWMRGVGTAGAARLSGSLLLSGTTWKGVLDETRADARMAVSAGRRLDAWALVRLNLWPTGAPGDRPVVDLSRLMVGVRGRPVQHLDLGARFAWNRWTASRRSRDLWGEAFASPSSPAVGLVGLDARWEFLDGLELRAEGDIDVTGPAATGWATGGGLSYTLQGRAPYRFEVRYRYEDGDFVRGHHAGAEIRMPFHSSVALDAGYRFSRYESAASDPALEHDASLGLAARLHRSVQLVATAEWLQGDDVMALFASGRIDWRF